MLELYWEDINDKSYHIANLNKKDNIYTLDIIETGLKAAIKKGCMGIGNIDFLKNHYESEELFSFFKQRIPQEDNMYIKEILSRYDMKDYDEYDLLKNTLGKSMTDRYYLLLKEENQ